MCGDNETFDCNYSTVFYHNLFSWRTFYGKFVKEWIYLVKWTCQLNWEQKIRRQRNYRWHNDQEQKYSNVPLCCLARVLYKLRYHRWRSKIRTSFQSYRLLVFMGCQWYKLLANVCSIVNSRQFSNRMNWFVGDNEVSKNARRHLSRNCTTRRPVEIAADARCRQLLCSSSKHACSG